MECADVYNVTWTNGDVLSLLQLTTDMLTAIMITLATFFC